MTYVIINDFVAGKRIKLLFLEEDFELSAKMWDRSDQILHDLQHLDMFAGRFRWRDLDPIHYREMVAKNLQYVADMPEEDRINDDDPIVSSLNYLICTLIYCIEKRANCHVELLKINRVEDLEISIEFSAEMHLEVNPPHDKGKADTPGGFSVVVDNT